MSDFQRTLIDSLVIDYETLFKEKPSIILYFSNSILLYFTL